MLSGLLTLVLPYTLFFIAALVKAFKERGRKNVFLILYLFSIIFPYIFVTSHRMRYMVPALPAVAALIIWNYSLERKYFKFPFQATGVAALLVSVVTLVLTLRTALVGLPVFIIGLVISVMLFYFLIKRDLTKSAPALLLFSLFFLGFLYSNTGLWEIPEDIVKKVEGRKFSTLSRRPLFLPFRAGRLQFNNVTDTESFKEAAEAGSIIYFPQRKIKKLEKFMDSSGYESYEKIIEWERFNETPKNKAVMEAIKTGDIKFLKEKTYFIKVKQDER
jgi:hypothetical protein